MSKILPSAESDPKNSAQFEYPVDLDAVEVHSQQLIDMVEGGGTHKNKATDEYATHERQPCPRQRPFRQPSEKNKQRRADHRHKDDKGGLHNSPLFVPALIHR